MLLALRNRQLAAALVAAGGALLYPPAAVLAVGVLCVSALGWSEGRPRIDVRRAPFAALALGLAAVAVLGPQLASGGAPRVMTAAEARAFPEFGADGPLHFFVPSVVEYLSQNRSGFDLRTAGSILAVAALALLLLRPANLRLLRREVLALPVVALCAWGLSQAVLFKLYLPHRYTYPLLAFFAIAVAVSLEPTWRAFAARRRLRTFALLASPLAVCLFAVYVFPLAPERAGTAVHDLDAGADRPRSASRWRRRSRCRSRGPRRRPRPRPGWCSSAWRFWARRSSCPTACRAAIPAPTGP